VVQLSLKNFCIGDCTIVDLHKTSSLESFLLCIPQHGEFSPSDWQFDKARHFTVQCNVVHDAAFVHCFLLLQLI